MVDVAPLGKRVSNGKRGPWIRAFSRTIPTVILFLCNEPSRCYLLRVVATRLNLVELNLIESQFGRNLLFHLTCFNTLAKKNHISGYIFWTCTSKRPENWTFLRLRAVSPFRRVRSASLKNSALPEFHAVRYDLFFFRLEFFLFLFSSFSLPRRTLP